MPIPDVLELRADALRVQLAPAHGGVIRRFVAEIDGRAEPLLRECDGPVDRVLDAACFPMVPFCNRIVPPQIETGGRTVDIPRAVAAWSSYPIHGLGWCSPWRVRLLAAGIAVLQHTHDGSVWPWPYEAEQRFTLTSDALTITLRLTNLSDEPMPFGLGLHPYFPRPAGTTLTTHLDGCWDTDAVPVPREWRALGPDERFDDGRTMDGAALDHCFTGWSGAAEIAWRDRPVRIALATDPAVSYLQVYAPRDESSAFFCVEPMSHVPNRLDHRLAPGAHASLAVRLGVVAR